MPQFASLMLAAPATPVATSTSPSTSTSTTAAPTAAAVDTLSPADPASPTFLAQFKSALKNIASAVALPQIAITRPPAAQTGGSLLSSASEHPSEAPTAASDKPVDPNMPALLAELGFAIVPLTFGGLPQTAATSNASTAIAPHGTTVAHVQSAQVMPLLGQLPAAPGSTLGQAPGAPPTAVQADITPVQGQTLLPPGLSLPDAQAAAPAQPTQPTQAHPSVQLDLDDRWCFGWHADQLHRRQGR